MKMKIQSNTSSMWRFVKNPLKFLEQYISVRSQMCSIARCAHVKHTRAISNLSMSVERRNAYELI